MTSEEIRLAREDFLRGIERAAKIPPFEFQEPKPLTRLDYIKLYACVLGLKYLHGREVKKGRKIRENRQYQEISEKEWGCVMTSRFHEQPYQIGFGSISPRTFIRKEMDYYCSGIDFQTNMPRWQGIKYKVSNDFQRVNQ